MTALILFVLQMAFANPIFDGAYARSCHLVGDDALSARVQVRADLWVHSYTAYEEETCQTPYLIYEVQSKAVVAGEFLDLEVLEVSYASMTDEVTRALNMVNYCGFKNWKTRQKKVVTGLECDEFQTPKAGEKTYSSFKLVQNVGALDELYLGKGDGTFNGKTPKSRHQAFETVPYVKIP